MKNRIHELKNFYILWSTQGLSQLSSAMTNFALTLWLYQETGSALQTALLTICSYAPYVIMSIFAGALSDKWDKKRTMLVCDTFAACCTVLVFILLKTGSLRTWHLYVLNAVNGLMNTVQRPASDVANTLITPKKYYQKTSGLIFLRIADHHSAPGARCVCLCTWWYGCCNSSGFKHFFRRVFFVIAVCTYSTGKSFCRRRKRNAVRVCKGWS